MGTKSCPKTNTASKRSKLRKQKNKNSGLPDLKNP